MGPVLTRICGGRIHPKPVRAITAQRAPAIYLFNHGSALDVFVIISMVAIGTVGVGKKELIKTPFFGIAFWLAAQLLIDRQNPRKARESLAETAEVMHRHRLSVCMAPEGTQSNDGRLLHFKKGFAHMALATKLPIVPVVIHGAHKVWPARTWDLHAGDIHVEVLDNIDTTDWTRERLGEHVAEVRAAYNRALGADQKGPE